MSACGAGPHRTDLSLEPRASVRSGRTRQSHGFSRHSIDEVRDSCQVGFCRTANPSRSEVGTRTIGLRNRPEMIRMIWMVHCMQGIARNEICLARPVDLYSMAPGRYGLDPNNPDSWVTHDERKPEPGSRGTRRYYRVPGTKVKAASSTFGISPSLLPSSVGRRVAIRTGCPSPRQPDRHRLLVRSGISWKSDS